MRSDFDVKKAEDELQKKREERELRKEDRRAIAKVIIASLFNLTSAEAGRDGWN